MATCAAEDFSAIVAAPGFALGLHADAQVVREIVFLPPSAGRPACTPLGREAVRQLHAWLADARFVFDLPCAPAGTAFQRRVWAAIAAILPGQTLSYGELASQLGTAARAVGAACGANPLPIVVPCHRVCGARGGLGGFNHARAGFLLDVKRWLLAHDAGRV